MPHDHDLDHWEAHHSTLLDLIERLFDMATTAELRALAAAQKTTISALGAYVTSLQNENAALKASQGLTEQEQEDIDAAATDVSANTATAAGMIPPPAVETPPADPAQ